jgi:hemin uptake protein HemP
MNGSANPLGSATRTQFDNPEATAMHSVIQAQSRNVDLERREREVRQPPRHDARYLTAGGVEAEIRLDGVRYVLRITRQGKLILTK